MANLKVGLNKKSIAILLVIFFLVLGGGGGYLLWRVNQAKTVAPTDSSASEGTGGVQKPPTDPKPPVNPPVVTSITLTYKAGAGGKVSKEGGTLGKTVTFNLKKGGSGTQVLAQADRGYKFKSWSVKADAGEKETEKKPWSTAIIGASQGGDEKRIDKEVKTSITVTAVFTKSCGDKKCDTWESEDKNCPADCEGCGDGVCTPPENPATCFEDCRSSSKFCGDGTCSGNENKENCPDDCKAETPVDTPVDVPVDTPDSPVCGDGVCNGDESMETCPADCDIPPVEGETVPETGIFDDTRNVVMMGVVLFGLGIGWTRISKTYGKLVQRRKENFEKRVVEG
jgi:hypothetical protein